MTSWEEDLSVGSPVSFCLKTFILSPDIMTESITKTESEQEIELLDAEEHITESQKEIDRLERAKDKHYEDIRNLNDAIRMIQKNVEMIQFILSEENLTKVENLLEEMKTKKAKTPVEKLKSDSSL